MTKTTEYNEATLQGAVVTELTSIIGKQLPEVLDQKAEAKNEGGYDVRLALSPTRDDRGTALFLQFKRSEIIDRSPAALGNGAAPHRRFKLKTTLAVNTKNKEPQHDLLLTLNHKHPCRVYYVTCPLKTTRELRDVVVGGDLLANLLCLHPERIGKPPTGKERKDVYFHFDWSHLPFYGPTGQRIKVHQQALAAVTWAPRYVLGFDGVMMLLNAFSHLEGPGNLNLEAGRLSTLLVEASGGVAALSDEAEFLWQASRRSEQYIGLLRAVARDILDAEVVYLVKEPTQ